MLITDLFNGNYTMTSAADVAMSDLYLQNGHRLQDLVVRSAKTIVHFLLFLAFKWLYSPLLGRPFRGVGRVRGKSTEPHLFAILFLFCSYFDRTTTQTSGLTPLKSKQILFHPTPSPWKILTTMWLRLNDLLLVFCSLSCGSAGHSRYYLTHRL